MSTSIPYLDEAWNVSTGCGDDMASPGCLNCYARRMFGRRLWRCQTCGGEGVTVGSGNSWYPSCPDCDFGRQDFRPTFHASRLDQPLHWRKPRVVGVSFMGDLFHEAITDAQLDDAFSVMEETLQHTYLILTKRPARMRDYVRELARIAETGTDPFPWQNVWLGVTICNQEEADRNIPILLATPAAKRWVSLEPMLGPVGLQPYLYRYSETWERDYLDWVVLGGETGPGARPMRPEWALDVYSQCSAAGVPFYFKQPGSWWQREVFLRNDDSDIIEMMAVHEMPEERP